MHLTYQVHDESAIPAARALIEQAMKAHMPGIQYSVMLHEEA
jgi:hypothetical protein